MAVETRSRVWVRAPVARGDGRRMSGGLRVQKRIGRAPGAPSEAGDDQPIDFWHVALQPGVFGGSHCSPYAGSTMPSPQ